MHAVIAGATGLVGCETLRQLIDAPRYARIYSIGRRPTGMRHDQLVEVTVDFEMLGSLPEEVLSEDVFCCLGTTIKAAGSRESFRRVDHDYVIAFANLMKARGARRFAFVSAVGAASTSGVFYSRVKGEAEEAVAAVGFEASHALRPSLLTGQRQAFRLGERLAIPAARLLAPLLPGALKKYRPVAATEVARQLLAAVASDATGHHVHFCR